jgi:Family of unknown function (DUF6610)
MAAPLLIYCAGNSRRFSDIACATGFVYGCRSDHKPSRTVGFADLNWKRPDLDRHYAFVRDHQPTLAVAPDVLELDQLTATLAYAERLATHAEHVVIVPKAQGVMGILPREPWLVIGYSVPTKYGGTDLMMAEIVNWPVHLLGGSPRRQFELAHYLNVVSADGNAAARAAEYGTVFDAHTRRWQKSVESRVADMPYRAFARSCQQIVQMWHEEAA